MNPNSTPKNQKWLEQMLALEDRCESISVGGLASDLGLLGQVPTHTTPDTTALAKLIELSRRMFELTAEQLAVKADLDLAQLVSLERGDISLVEPRTIHKLATHLKLPEGPLMELAGLVARVDPRLNEAAVRFAARSEPLDKLSREERGALDQFVKELAKISDGVS